MYLLVMVSTWYYVERELVRMAARVGDPASKIPFEEYKSEVTAMAEPSGQLRRLEERLNLSGYSDWNTLDALRLLANGYKHDPFNRPQQGLLKKLGLDTAVAYGP